MDFNKTLSKLLGNDHSIDEVQIDKRVIQEIINIAINSDPKEYVALLSGSLEDSILKIKGLIFLPFKASDTSAVMQVFMMPITTNAVGSVHSHPGPSAQPSKADLTFFAKNGYFHMIICRPYNEFTIRAYDAFGNPMNYVVKDFGDDVEIKTLNENDITRELFDDELLEELEEIETEEGNDKLPTNVQENNLGDIMKDENNQNNQNQPAYVNLQIESEGKIIEKQLPLPPEYEPGDDIIVDIRTDKTPGDSIDEIVLHVNKAENNIIDVEAQEPKIVGKSAEELDKEIKAMESDIERLKAENERLKNNR